MLSLIEVECPHCGARGQIMVPPVGAIIIGPCPQCQELVVLFEGHELPLEKDVMNHGTTDERHEHLMDVLTDFLHNRIGQLLSDEEVAKAVEEESEEGPIADEEFKRFMDVDLKLLDNKAYFKSVFG